MLHSPFTPGWASAFRSAINSSAEYRESAKSWLWPVALVLTAAPDLGYPADIALELQLSRGDCSAAALVDLPAVTAPFVLRGDYATWKEIVRGELDPLMAVTRRRIIFTGALTTLLLHAKAARALVGCAQQVPTQFAGEAGAGA